MRSTLDKVRPNNTTAAPSAASASAAPMPAPCPAPVTIATLPSSFPLILFLSSVASGQPALGGDGIGHVRGVGHAGEEAAIDADALARQVKGFIRREERDQRGDILATTEPRRG